MQMNNIGNGIQNLGFNQANPIPGLDGGDVPDLAAPAAAQPGVGADQNNAAARNADMPAVNLDNVAVPTIARAYDKAGDARVAAGDVELRKGNLAGAAADFTKGAEDFEKEADALLAGLNKAAAAAAGGGAPVAAAPPVLPAPPPAAPPAPITPPAPPAPPAPAAGGAGPSPWTVKTNTLDPAKGSWSSTGDPHEVSGDGLKFDNQKTGKFDLVQSAGGDFRVQNDQGPDKTGRWPGMTLNHAVAVKDGADVVAYDGLSKTLNVNGKDTALPTPGHPITLPGGGKIEATADGLKVTSSKGDTVDVHQKNGYLDLNGQLGPNRKDDEVRGGLGEFHDENDTNRDLKGRTGDEILGKPGDAGAIDKFEEAWRAKDDLFPKPVVATGGGAPANTSPAWTVKTNTLTQNNTFASVGDPHDTTGDGLHFDNEKTGVFDLLKSATGDLLVQNNQGPDKSGRWPGATLNHAVAVKDGADVVKYDGLSKTLNINGKDVPVPKNGEKVALPGGGSVVGTADGLKILTHKNDEIDIGQRDQYLDITGKLGDRKDGEVRGAVGEFHQEKDQDRDLKGRTGDDIVGKPGDKGAIDKFEELWRTPEADNMFAVNPAKGGGAPDDIDKKVNAIEALQKAGDAHLKAAHALEAQNDWPGAAKELQAAALDFERSAAMITSMGTIEAEARKRIKEIMDKAAEAREVTEVAMARVVPKIQVQAQAV